MAESFTGDFRDQTTVHENLLLQESCENPHQVCTASHARCISTCNELEGLHGKIIITIVQRYTRKRNHLLVAVGIVTALV